MVSEDQEHCALAHRRQIVGTVAAFSDGPSQATDGISQGVSLPEGGPQSRFGRAQLSFREMTELDVRYWREWSAGRDFLILLRTPSAAFVERCTA